MTAGSWYIEANIAYCTEEPATMLTLYYTVNMATIVYQFEENLVEGLAVDLADLAWCPKVNKGPGIQPVFIDLMLIALFTS